MWNTELNLNDLINKFMPVYFKGAEKEMREYFDYIHEHAEYLNKVVNRQMIHVHFDDEPNKRFYDERFWPIGVLDKCIEIFDRALSHDLDEITRNRVLLESLPAKFTKLFLYRNRLDKDYLLKLMDEVCDIAEKMNVKAACDAQPRSVQGFVEQWKNEMELN